VLFVWQYIGCATSTPVTGCSQPGVEAAYESPAKRYTIFVAGPRNEAPDGATFGLLLRRSLD
jgi:hypothetical protein